MENKSSGVNYLTASFNSNASSHIYVVWWYNNLFIIKSDKMIGVCPERELKLFCGFDLVYATHNVIRAEVHLATKRE